MTQSIRRGNILLILSGVLALGMIIVYMILGRNGLFASSPLAAVIFCMAIAVCIGVFVATFFSYREKRKILKQLLLENKYVLGREDTFYNSYCFSEHANRIRKYHRGENATIILFTATNARSGSYSSDHASEIVEFNGYVAEWIVSYFGDEKAARDVGYGLHNGSFVICVYGDDNRLSKIIDDIENGVYEIVATRGSRLYIQPFFGIATWHEDEDLIHCLTNAMTAKVMSERNFETKTFFNEAIHGEVEAGDIDMITDGLRDHEFVVYYQPKFSLKTKRFISSEALIRLNSKKYGLVPPSKFIDRAERAGLIHEIDMYVFRQVCADLNETKRRGRRLLPVSINFSLYEFYAPHFADDIISIINEYHVSPKLIELEITEGTTQKNSFIATSIMRKFKDLGIRILMDDFGVAYSNLNNLKKLPIDVVKIDKSFIDNIVEDPKAYEIVKFLISFCIVNGLETVAEGVDNKDELELLRKAKCDTIQGYYYSPPIPNDKYQKLLVDNPFEVETKGGK